MCRPLKDIVTELEEKYKEGQLSSLEERARIIRDYDASIEYLLKLMDDYIQEVSYTLEHKLSVSIISRITYNLISHIAHSHDLMIPYSINLAVYLMDSRYDENYQFWKDFDEKGNKLVSLIEKLIENNIFDLADIDKKDVLQNLHVIQGFYGEIPSKVKQEIELSYSNGVKLLYCLEYMIEMMDNELATMKMSHIMHDGPIMLDYYKINYLLYAKTYWPKQERSFRLHITNQRLRNKVTINGLEDLRRETIQDFENHTGVGRIWRNYSEDVVSMAEQLKDEIKSEAEWKYFFQTIFELDEYDRWIDELRNPPEAKIKAEKLTSNKQFMTVMARAVEQGLCSQQDWQFKWNEKKDAVYFASVASHKFNLSNRHDRDGDLTISWKPFECLFGDKGFRSLYNDYQNGKYKLPNKNIIDKLLK